MDPHRLTLAAGLVSLVLGSACGGRQSGPSIAVSPVASPGIEPEADGQAHATLPTGQRAAPPLAGVAYMPDQFSDWSVSLEAGACYAFGFAGDPGVSRLVIYLWDPAGRRVAASRSRSGAGAVSYCPVVSGGFRLEAKVTAGAGHYVVVPYQSGGALRAPMGTVATSAPATLPVVSRGAVLALPAAAPGLDIPTAIDRQAAVAAVGASRLGDFFTGVGDQSDWSAQLTAGTCYWFVGAGEAGKVQGLTLSLWDPRNAPITSARSEAQVATLAYCAKETGAHRFEAKVNGGHGDFKVAVYSK